MLANQIINHIPVSAIKSIFNKPHILFFILIVVFGMYFLIVTPPMWGLDEPTHIARAYQLSQGHLKGEHLKNNSYGGEIPRSLYNVISYEVYNRSTTGYVSKVNERNYSRLLTTSIKNSKDVVFAFPNTVFYSPVSYVPSIVAIKISEWFSLSVGALIFMARFFDLLSYGLIIFAGLWFLKDTKIVWLAFVIALLPTAIGEAAIITADTLTNAIAFLLSATIIKSFFSKRLSNPEIITIILSCIALPLLKPTYLILIVLSWFIPSKLFKSSNSALLVKIMGSFVGVTLMLMWMFITKNEIAAAATILPKSSYMLINSRTQALNVLKDPLLFIYAFFRTSILNDGLIIWQTIGGFGYNNYLIPGSTILMYFMAFVLAGSWSEKPKLTKTMNILIPAILVTGVGLVFLAEYLTFSPLKSSVIDGVQGRYFVPYLLLLVVWLTGLFRSQTKQSFSGKVAIVGMIVIGLTLACIKYNYITYHHLPKIIS